MSENQAKASSKAAKKNTKRNSKKSTHHDKDSDREMVDLNNILTELKKQLSEAKSNKDHKGAAALRDKIWVLTDLIAWVRTDIPQEELDEIITSIHEQFNTSTTTAVPTVAGTTVNHESPTTATAPVEDRRLRNLRKKLAQIEALKERQQSGEALEDNQIAKISSEEQVLEEIRELEQIMADVVLTH